MTEPTASPTFTVIAFFVIDRRSPPVSPSVVAAIFITLRSR